ncbi:MAG: hypothetical protein ABR899_02725 [Candidatus Krumholzibacteriaceae bacterium]
MNRITRVFKIFGTGISYLQFGRPAIPLLMYFALKLCIIFWYVLSGANTPGGLWPLLMRGIDLAAMGHYPAHLILMPAVLGRLDIPLEILVLVVAQGATVLLVAAASKRQKTGLRESLGSTGRRYGHLVVAAAAVSAALFAWFRLSGAFLARFTALPRGLGEGAGVLIGLAIETLFLYTIPFILIEGRTAPEAIRRSFAFARRHFIESFLLVFVPFLLTVPTLLLSVNPSTIALRISPEFLVQVQVASELMQFVATYLLMGGITIYFTETRPEEGVR